VHSSVIASAAAGPFLAPARCSRSPARPRSSTRRAPTRRHRRSGSLPRRLRCAARCRRDVRRRGGDRVRRVRAIAVALVYAAHRSRRGREPERRCRRVGARRWMTLAAPANASTAQAARNGPAAALAITELCRSGPPSVRRRRRGGCADAFASLRPVSASLGDPVTAAGSPPQRVRCPVARTGMRDSQTQVEARRVGLGSALRARFLMTIISHA